MIVWEVLARGHGTIYDSRIGLYTTKEKAEAKIKLMKKTAKEMGWYKDGFRVEEVELE